MNQLIRSIFTLAGAAAIVMFSGCAKQSATGPISAENTVNGKSASINGAGATFPYPVYSKWADKYKEISGLKINYQPIGSGGGVQQIKAATVDFGASDAPLTADELNKADLIQFPMIMGGIVPVVNLGGAKLGKIKLSPDILADIYLGKIKKWNDPAIAKDNPGLPGSDITVVHRSDGSGTSWIFTNYLDKISPDWHSKVGFGKAVSWPAGVGGKGNEGVAAYVQRIDGAIGYVEYAYALQSKMNVIQLKNKAGNFVTPSAATFQAAAANADWANAPGYYVVLTDQQGKDSWPITGASYIIMHKNQKDEKTAESMLSFFDWSYSHGADIAKGLDYVPMPESVVKLVKARWAKEITADGKAVYKE